ncbi:apolipoprotein N-acyltransferase [Roseiflexus castenholzii]|uniref:Nitrilase/cyanide hydratase and apolipoprotein N-acyltransferase n=1 Tax=Roseiflexus castenholzii (strain DSM 13941 / HLO8) TaxID=383372 RepID=A7NKZ8_ROSCS|nr:nitrilase-related carbon-nitrogen hydrolase [Roseiflexus castenholzii]ABU58168.1 Nitrilase/cyanide hydratase and apolipoprotein N-acyltransferase [Roseiflexus castenholzii DSM 13941]
MAPSVNVRAMATPAAGRVWSFSLTLSLLSGMLIGASMPTILDWGLLGWIGVAPLLIALHTQPLPRHFVIALPFGIIWSAMAHLWYPAMFGPVLGVVLIIAVGCFYAGLVQAGTALQERLPEPLSVLGAPIAWSALEFLRFIAPITGDWWIELLAKSQWRFPPALQILTLTGFPGLGFLVMLVNSAIAFLIVNAWRRRRAHMPAVVSLIVAAAIIVWGALIIPPAPDHRFRIAATVDLTNQDRFIQALSRLPVEQEGYYADTPEMSQAIFDVNAALTRSVAALRPAFIVWPENEFASADDPVFTAQVGDLAREMNAYLVADMVWRTSDGMYDTAVMFGPDGAEVGRRAKINVTDGEKEFGFLPGPRDFSVVETPYGQVGLGVCWDRHLPWIVRELASAGAQIVLMPVDDDFSGNRWFPPAHASDTVFRAVENRVAFGLGATSGIAMVIDPYGRITAESDINQRGVVTGETFVVAERTLFTRFGDWFGWLAVLAMVIGFVARPVWQAIKKPPRTL